MKAEDKQKGFYRKYKIEKADGSPVDSCAEYFVLRIDTDIHARKALATYAKSVEKENPVFARDLINWLKVTNGIN
jgi:hypothetical protein